MTPGYSGKILYINLSNRKISTLNTEKYEEFAGGNGMGAAIFWDLCKDKTISGFDPGNVITVMPGPLAGTITPGASRTEICGINVFSYPIEWFSRSNIGGFFGSRLKYAGWDGIVIKGMSDSPVWINIINDTVAIEDAKNLWGMCTRSTQKEIWRSVTGQDSFGEWVCFDNAQTTQGPSILCIGPGGESLSRMGTIQSGGGMSAGQGGFGAVWGAKKLKAISVIGTGSINIADPITLLSSRKYICGLIKGSPIEEPAILMNDGRQTSCPGCIQKCKSRRQSGAQQDAMCLGGMTDTNDLYNNKTSSDIIQMYGLNMNDLTSMPITDGVYLKKLYKMGIIGPGKAIDTHPLPMDKFGSSEFTEILCRAIVNREGIGADLSEGLIRAARKWGRLEKDTESGLLNKSQWGYTWHWSLPFVEQGYGSLLGDRDINKHGFSMNRLWADIGSIGYDRLQPEKIAELQCKKMIPYEDDPLMMDFSWQEKDTSNMEQALETGIYSMHKAKLIAWQHHYTRFWIDSVMFCDHLWPVFFSAKTPDFSGTSPTYEPILFNAVTGKNLTFAESMERGRKIWNLNRAIWTLQGRHRDIERFAGFMYTPTASFKEYMSKFAPPSKHHPDDSESPEPKRVRRSWSANMTVFKDGKWSIADLGGLFLDKDGVEQWKTHYYETEGWDPDTGWPMRKTLEELGLKYVADTLDRAGKLGRHA